MHFCFRPQLIMDSAAPIPPHILGLHLFSSSTMSNEERRKQAVYISF